MALHLSTIESASSLTHNKMERCYRTEESRNTVKADINFKKSLKKKKQLRKKAKFLYF